VSEYVMQLQVTCGLLFLTTMASLGYGFWVEREVRRLRAQRAKLILGQARLERLERISDLAQDVIELADKGDWRAMGKPLGVIKKMHNDMVRKRS
jgi:hypothetical protein